MMMVVEPKTASLGNRLKPVIGKLLSEHPTRSPASAIEPVVGPRHAEQAEARSQTPLVERRVVGHQRQISDQGRNPGPHIREIGCIGRIGSRHTVNERAEPTVIIRPRVDQPISRIDNRTVAHDHQTDRTDARPFAVRGFEIDGGEIFHRAKITKKTESLDEEFRFHVPRSGYFASASD